MTFCPIAEYALVVVLLFPDLDFWGVFGLAELPAPLLLFCLLLLLVIDES